MALLCIPLVTSATPSLMAVSPLPEVRARMVSISKAKQTDTPRSPGFRQTINGSTQIAAV